MGDEITNNDLHDEQEAEAVETISLTDFPITQDHRNPPSPPPSTTDQDFFEFSREESTDNSQHTNMSHAEDKIFCGKLVPINHQHHRHKPPHQTQNNQPVGCRRSRSESMAKAKTTNVSPLVRTSRSLDYKKLNRNSSMSSEPPSTEITRDGSGKKSSSSRWYVLLFGLVNVPPAEMDMKDIKSRHVRRSSSESFTPVSRGVDHRKCSWRVLGFLSCKSANSAAVTTTVGYMPQV